MKKNFTCKNTFVLFLILFISFSAKAQCVPDTSSFELITPVSDSLPCVERGVFYTTAIQFFCPPQLATTNIDSIIVTSFAGLPTGLSYACTPGNCKLYPWEHACLLVSGTTTDTAGTYLIDYNGTAYTSDGSFTFHQLQNFGGLPEYALKVIEPGDPCRATVQDTTGTGVRNISSLAANLTVYPNPSKGRVTVDVQSSVAIQGQLSITNAVGAVVFETPINTNGSYHHTINLSEQPKGIYLLQLHTQSGFAVQKIMID